MRLFRDELSLQIQTAREKTLSRACARACRRLIEGLEGRQLLSSTLVDPASAIPFQHIVIDQNPGRVPVEKVLADLNGDGKLDAVIGHENNFGGGRVDWYEFPASGNPNDPWIKHTIDPACDAYEAMAPEDVNGDGAMDVIVSNRTEIDWYENPMGHGGNPATDAWVKHVIGSGGTHELLLTADLDGDGKLDVATNAAIFFQNSPVSWTKIASPIYTRTQKGLGIFNSGSGLGAIDLIGTGASPYSLTWFENPRDHGGNARTDTWIPHVFAPGYDTTHSGVGISYASMDVNGDGRDDIISAVAEAPDPLPPPPGGMIWWEAPVDRKNGTWIKHTIDASIEVAHNIRLGDFNNDGQMDISFAEQDQSEQKRVGILFNVGGTGQNWEMQVLLATNGGHNQWVADDDGDGDLDILSSPHGYYTGINPIDLFQSGLKESGITRATIGTQPQSQVIPAGNTAVFSVSATANAPLAYLWLRDGLAIPGATSSTYTLNNVSAADNGAVFRCVVSDAAGFVNSDPATLAIGSPTGPQASLASAPNLTTGGGATYQFTVNYLDNVNITASTLGDGNLIVTGPGGYSQPATLLTTGLSDSPSLTATYSVPAPGGTWDNADNGTYTITLQANEVSDTSNQFFPPGDLGTFAVNIPLPAAGSLNGSQAVAASGYNLTTLGTSDWVHWGRGGKNGNFDEKSSGGTQISNVTVVGAGSNVGGFSNTVRSVTWTDGSPTASGTNDHGFIWSNGALNTGYFFTAPADTTTRTLYVYAGANGAGISLTAHLSDGSAADFIATATGSATYTNLYTITYRAASANQTLQITFLKTQNVTGTDGSADLIAAALAVASDGTPPSASLTAQTLTTASSNPYMFNVTWSDATAVKASTLGNGNLVVTGPGGYSQPATLVTSGLSNGSPLVATYSVPAPAGGWQNASNGAYTVTLQANQVSDMLGNFTPTGSLGQFNVNVTIAPTPGAPVLSAATDSGASASDGITNFNNSSSPKALQFTVSGTTSGATVTLYADGTAIGSAVASGTSTTITTNGSATLGDGSHGFMARQTISGQTQSIASSATSVTIDTAIPAGALSASSLTTAGSDPYTFSVSWSDDIAVRASTLGNGNLIVTGPGTYSQSTTLVTNGLSNGSPLVATYSVPAPSVGWQNSSNGAYTVSLQVNQVSDTAGNFASAGSLGQFNVNVPIAPTPDAPALSAASDSGASNSDGITNLNNGSPGTELEFTVSNTTSGATVTLYADGVAIGSAVTNDVTTTITTNGNSTLDNSNHNFTARQTISGQTQSAASGATSAKVDDVPPAGLLTASTLTTAGSDPYTFSVSWGDSTAVLASSIGDGNFLVTGPGGYSQTTTLLTSGLTDGSPLVATYSIPAPAGGWQSASNGAYTVSLQASQISDTAGNIAPAADLEQFSVNIPLPVSPATYVPILANSNDSGILNDDDTTNFNNSTPDKAMQFVVIDTATGATVTVYSDGVAIGSAVANEIWVTVLTDGTTTLADGTHHITARQTAPGKAESADSPSLDVKIDITAPAGQLSAAPVTSPSSDPHTFTVNWSDATAVDASTLGDGNLVVTSPGGYNEAAMLLSTVTDSGSPLVATYSIPAPNGGWQVASNDTYSVSLQSDQVADTVGNVALSGSVGQFAVNIPLPVSPTPDAPVLSSSTDSGISTSDGVTNFNNSGGPTALQFTVGDMISGATVTLYADGVAIGSAVASDVTTTITTDGTTTLASGSHNITARQTVPGDTESVDSSATAVTIDTAAPGGVLSASTLTTATSNAYTFTVTWSDATAVLASTLGDGNLVVTSPGGYNQAATLLTTSLSDGSPLVATYSIPATSGGWQFASNDTYTVALQATHVSDTVGNIAAAGTIGQFVANIPQPVSPTPGAPVLQAATDSGSSSSDGITNFNNNGSGKALQFLVSNTTVGATVTLYADGVAIGSAVASDVTTLISTNGTATLTNASHSFTAKQIIPGQLVSTASGSTSVTIDAVLPTASSTPAGVTTAGATSYTLTVSYSDANGINAGSFNTNDIVVSGPNGFSQTATFVSATPAGNGSPRTATYSITPPGGTWDSTDNGTYTVSMAATQVSDIAGNFVVAGSLGTFSVNVPAPATGLISGSMATAASGYNLTTLGTSDWAHWGRGGTYGNFDHQSTGGSQISNVTLVGTGSKTGGFSNTVRSTTWTGGTPTSSGTNDHGYIWSNGALNTGFSFTVPADTTTRTLYVYAGGNGVGTTLTAQLSDGTAAPYTVTASGSGTYTELYKITYHAASAGQTLKITFLKTQNVTGTQGSADLIAAALVVGTG